MGLKLSIGLGGRDRRRALGGGAPTSAPGYTYIGASTLDYSNNSTWIEVRESDGLIAQNIQQYAPRHSIFGGFDGTTPIAQQAGAGYGSWEHRPVVIGDNNLIFFGCHPGGTAVPNIAVYEADGVSDSVNKHIGPAGQASVAYTGQQLILRESDQTLFFGNTTADRVYASKYNPTGPTFDVEGNHTPSGGWEFYGEMKCDQTTGHLWRVEWDGGTGIKLRVFSYVNPTFTQLAEVSLPTTALSNMLCGYADNNVTIMADRYTGKVHKYTYDGVSTLTEDYSVTLPDWAVGTTYPYRVQPLQNGWYLMIGYGAGAWTGGAWFLYDTGTELLAFSDTILGSDIDAKNIASFAHGVYSGDSYIHCAATGTDQMYTYRIDY